MRRERLQNLLPLILVAVVVVAFVFNQVGWLDPVEGLFLRVVSPLQKATSFVATRARDMAQTWSDLRDLRQRNRELEAENARLLLDNVRLREWEHEALLLQDLLGFVRANLTLEVVGAHVVGRVIGHDPSNLERYLTLDVGREEGIRRNMPVITDRGLVGRISEAGEGWSRVLLIIDPSSLVNALTQSTRAGGLVQGNVEGSLVMRNVLQSDTLSVGDTVFTSGLGGTFPRQILIGQITEVDRKDFEVYQTALVQPTVDFEHLEVVLVLTGFQSIEPAPGEGADG